MAAATGFMESPLVIWVQTFSGSHDPVKYRHLCDGVFLTEVMQQIDPRPNPELTNGTAEEAKDIRERIQIWDSLLKNIKDYYQAVLQQYIVMKLPNYMTICKRPESDQAKKELLKVLLLLLGCAVQCEKRELFIKKITSLDLDVQQDIKEYIEEITDDRKNVFAVEMSPQHMDEVSHNLYHHLRTLVEEREGYVEEIKEMSQNVHHLEELYQSQRAETAQKLSLAASPSGSPEKQEKHHMAVELAESKAKMRKLRQELEEKTEHSIELAEELEEHRSMLQKFRAENLELTQDARAARTYRDELDILKEKTSRVEKYEAEITKYKEKLNEMDFYKTRVEELREDNAVLVETKLMLEDQLSSSNKRVETVIELENELVRYRDQLEQMAASRDQDRCKIQELAEINAQLEFQKKGMGNESANLEDELNRARAQLNSGLSNSISDQFNESSNNKILRLELENQRLQKQLEDMKQGAIVENTARFLELEKENHRLAKKVEHLQKSGSKESQHFIELEETKHKLEQDNSQLQKTIETVKESADRHVRELEWEKEHLTQTVASLRERNEKTHDLRVKDLKKKKVPTATLR